MWARHPVHCGIPLLLLWWHQWKTSRAGCRSHYLQDDPWCFWPFWYYVLCEWKCSLWMRQRKTHLYLLSPSEKKPPTESTPKPTKEELQDAEKTLKCVPSYAPPEEKYVNLTTKQKSHWKCMPAGAPTAETSDNLPKTYWKPSTKNVDTLIVNPPDLRQNLLLWVLWRAEVLYVTWTDRPPWAIKLDLPKTFCHLLTCQKAPKEFIIRFLEASFEIPDKCHKKNQSFITPIIPWEFSQDSYLPLPKDHDYMLIIEYDKAWVCICALTYSVMVTENNCWEYPKMTDEEQEEAYQNVLTGVLPPGKSPMYIWHCQILDEWKPYIYKESLLVKAYQVACSRYNVFLMKALTPFWDYSGMCIWPYLPLRPVCSHEDTLNTPLEDMKEALHLGIDNWPQANPLTGYEWGAPQTDQLIQRRKRDKGQHKYRTTMDIQGISMTNKRTHPLARWYANITYREVWSMMMTELTPIWTTPYSKMRGMPCLKDPMTISTAENVCRLGKGYREVTK